MSSNVLVVSMVGVNLSIEMCVILIGTLVDLTQMDPA